MELKTCLVKCLTQNRDVFASVVEELAEISPEIMEHHLNVNQGVKPMKQKRRHFGLDKNKVIKIEVDRLLQVGHIRDVQFSIWLSNIVLVPKVWGNEEFVWIFETLIKLARQIITLSCKYTNYQTQPWGMSLSVCWMPTKGITGSRWHE